MRKKITALIAGVTAFLLSAGVVFALPNFRAAEVKNPQTGDGVTAVTVPETAIEVSPALFDLGQARDRDGRLVRGYMLIHYQKGYSHQTGQAARKPAKSCFSYLARGAKWRGIEPWLVNPANTSGLVSDFVLGNLGLDIDKWEDAADGVVNGVLGADILGAGATTADVLVADTVSPDGLNEVYFANIADPGAIAVTIVWGIFAGPPATRELVEWDQVYDDVDFAWSATGEAAKMDFANIATHELGHSVGMGHPDDFCTEETMYRFAEFGETKKRDLNSGDIKGIDGLY